MAYQFRPREEPFELYSEFENAEESLTSDFAESWQGEVSRTSPDYIRWVQRSLNQILGLRLTEDGIMGSQTRSAIRSFQQRQGLAVDGIVGEKTERALVAASARPPPLSRAPSQPQEPSISVPVTPMGRRCRFRFTPRRVEVPGGGRIKDKTPPKNLVEVKGVGDRRIPLHPLAAEAWKALIDAARSDGIPHPLLLPTSGFRDPEHQRRLWERALKKYGSPQAARKWVAPPGSSPHQSGRAIDFYLGGKNSSGNIANLRRLPAYKWLVENAECFGFYPYEAEPWHWEYNPPGTSLSELEEFDPFDTELAGPEWEAEIDRRSREYIRWVQQSLSRIMGLRLDVDGIIGPKTRSAIRSFQQRQGLKADGIVGSQTESALIAAGASPPPDGGAVSKPTPSGVQNLGTGLKPPSDPDAYRMFRLTTYHVVDQRELPTGAVRVPIYDDSGRILAEGSPAFFAQLSLEGSARLDDGRLINVTGKQMRVSHDDYATVLAYHRRNLPKKPTTYSGIVVENDRVVRALTFHEVPAQRRGIGYGSLRGIPLVPFRTLAADIGRTKKSDPRWKGKGGLVPPGTHVYIKEYDGLRLPDGSPHDGWFIVNDTGGGIFGAHFDVFVGTPALRKQVKLPDFGHVWFAGIEQRIPLGYDYGLRTT
ncbi:MAG TPA: peptidoglycan-binding protein [Candidatus Competibacteraceae bacterium]|nr:peptidoglycan-binding protein [Candidatus Competibacteraceae bacterium]